MYIHPNNQNKSNKMKKIKEYSHNNWKVELIDYLTVLLNLNGEKSYNNIKSIMLMINDVVGCYTINEVKYIFKLYVLGKLSIDPKDNYMTLIQFNKVINAYKDYCYTNKQDKKILSFRQKAKIELPMLTESQQKEIVKMAVNRAYFDYLKDGVYKGVTPHIYDYLKNTNEFNEIKQELSDLKARARVIAEKQITELKKGSFVIKKMLSEHYGVEREYQLQVINRIFKLKKQKTNGSKKGARIKAKK